MLKERTTLEGKPKGTNSMIQKRLEDITEDDLTALIDNKVREGRTIDYKRELPGGNDASKKEYLADVSSFANTSGGDLIFGMNEVEAFPTEIVGIQSSDLDNVILRLEQILDSGLMPRIRRHLRVIGCSDDKKVIILRIERSWSGPHRVVFKDSDKFWGRNAAGKFPLDVNELRAAFNLSNTVTERIRGFRIDRIIAISNNETPVPIKLGPKVVMHLIPIESFAGQPQYDVIALYHKNTPFMSMGDLSMAKRLNLDGLLAHGYIERGVCNTYTQLYRNGILEVVSEDRVTIEFDNEQWFSTLVFEQSLLEYLPRCFKLLQEIGVNVPIIVALTVTNVRGLRMWMSNPLGRGWYTIDRDTLVLPESVVQEFQTPSQEILLSMFDLIWNACGYPKSKNFDDEGNWTGMS